MSYICLDCHKIFDDPKHYEERHGLDTPPFETWYGCPRCGGAYTEAYTCARCNEWIRGEYIKVDDERYCEDCYVVLEVGDE